MEHFVQIRFRTIAIVTVGLPLLSFLFCIIWSLLYNFKEATSTHCGVRNLLPSISAAIGGFTPQRYIWRIGVAVHTAPRMLIAAMYYKYYSEHLTSFDKWLAKLISILHIIEVFCLVGLTYVSSQENFPVHEKCFVTFMFAALSHMFISCLLPKYKYIHLTTDLAHHSLHVKSILGTVCAVSFMSAVYFYFRHNWYCEPGVYTLFAISEYIVVLSNMGFHMTAYWDFSDHHLTVGSIQGLRKVSQRQEFWEL